MKIQDVKKNLNKPVKYDGSDYILTACIIRKDERNNFVYTAELMDIKQKNSVIISRLDDVTST